ncbi:MULTISPECIES: hypothetical protein [Bacillaceae]|uniref:Uncharacterized protein n=1 Tax=Evansella alkalicola TaxID=745819 RepID=A0ABS6JSB6_9BACI|nr:MULTISPECIES: hypothetical protein [Bacillaceae]MBU9721463.1 hypothetical protein [Bacillus alkalicola]
MDYQQFFWYDPHHTREQEAIYPPIETKYFEESLDAYGSLLEHGKIVLESLSSSKEKMSSLMDAAQEGKDEEVDKIIKSTGVPTIVNTSYTPTGVTFTLYADAETVTNCCTLTMYLRWG